MPDGIEFSEFSGQQVVPRLAEAISLINQLLGPESALVDKDDTEYDRRKHFAVATDSEGHMIAAGAVLPFEDDRCPSMITELAVVPSHRGEGIGRRIVSMLTARAESLGASCIGVTALTQSSGFFEELGFKSEGNIVLVKELGTEKPRLQLEQAKEPFSFSELTDLRDQAVEQIESTAKNRLEREEEMVVDLQQRLLMEAYRFKRIFITTEGSTYFVTVDDASLRFRAGRRGRTKIQPVIQNQVLVDRLTSEKVHETAEVSSTLIGLSVSRAPYELGSFPFEFEVRSGAEISSIETDEVLTFPEGVSWYHMGHSITAIIK